MPIPLLVALLSPLLLAPSGTVRAALDAIAWQKAQIAVDNAAILIGRGDREVARALDAASRLLSGLDDIHHAWHACARVPATAPTCVPMDRALEAQILAAHAAAGAAARLGWAASPIRGLAEAGRLDVRPRISRPPLSLRQHHCPLCRLPTAWKVDSARGLRTELSVSAPVSLGARVRLLPVRGTWDYELEAAAGGS